MPFIPVDWYRAGPEVFAKADRMRRQMGALSQLAGVPRTMTQRYGQFQQGEDRASANEAELTARLGGAVTQAQQAGASESSRDPSAMDAMSPGMLGATPPVQTGPGTGDLSPLPVTQPGPGATKTYAPGGITEEKVSDPGSLVPSAQGPPAAGESSLGRYARMGAKMLFGADIPQPGRATRIGQLRGQEENRLDRMNTMRAMNPLLRRAVNPGQLWNAQMPQAQVPPDTQFTQPAAAGAAGQYSLGAQAQRSAQAKWTAAGNPGVVPDDQVALERMRMTPAMQPGSTVTDTTPIDPTTGQPPAPDSPLGMGLGGTPGKRTTTTRSRGAGTPEKSAGPDVTTRPRADKRTGDMAAKMKAILHDNPPQ